MLESGKMPPLDAPDFPTDEERKPPRLRGFARR